MRPRSFGGSLDCARDFGSGLTRPLNTSTSAREESAGFHDDIILSWLYRGRAIPRTAVFAPDLDHSRQMFEIRSFADWIQPAKIGEPKYLIGYLTSTDASGFLTAIMI